MVCKECGTQLPDIAKFCYKCGKTVDSAGLQEEFDPFGTEEIIPVTNSAKTNKENMEVKVDDQTQDKEDKNEDVKEVDESVEKEETKSEMVSESEDVEEEITTSEKTEDAEEKSDDETSKDENSEGEKSQTEEDQEDAPANSGFKIMINPDYVPPEVEEEKPFYEDHVNYEEIREQHAAKMEKRMQVLSVIIGIAVLIGIGLFVFDRYTASQDFDEKYTAAQALYDAGDYEGAFNAFGELVEHKGADEEEMVIKQFECLQAIGDNVRARDFAIDACREYSSDNIRKLLDAVNLDSGSGSKPSNTPAPSQTPSEAPSESPSEAPTETPSEAPVVTPSPVPEEPDVPMVDYTAYEDTFAQLYTGMDELMTKSNPIAALRVMITEDFAMLCTYKKTVYYSNAQFSETVTDADKVLMLCDNGYVYYGRIKGGKPDIAGVYMQAVKGESGITYTYYRGLWANGYPNGAGKIEKYDGATGTKTVISGGFAMGYYEGDMKITNYKGNTVVSSGSYNIVAGTPTVLKDTAGNDIKDGTQSVIGYVTNEAGTTTNILWDGTTKYMVEGLVY